jgi:hypothetical protein
MSDLTQAYLKACLTYDPETGVFRWKARPVHHFSAGGHMSSQSIADGWNAKYAGRICGCPDGEYWKITIDDRKYRAHIIAWVYVKGCFPVLEIDHRDKNGLNNCFLNLREATTSQNGTNKGKPSTNKSGAKGAHFHKGAQRWRAQIACLGKRRHLGYFDTPEAAHERYRQAARELHGEFARFE